MNRLSIRLGLLFFVFILLIESMLFFFLYYGIVSERIIQETENLLARGASHQSVLEKNFTTETMKHVALMESEAETAVVITNKEYNILESSNEITKDMEQVIIDSRNLEYSHQGKLLESKWKTENYMASMSPIIIDNNVKGFVYMFLNTKTIRNMIDELTYQFLIIGFISLLLSIITIFFLSRFIAIPLIQMKKVTEHISQGYHDLKLNTDRDDELGDLARSIESLSDDLARLKKDRNEFLSSISHELRTPLTYLKGYADVAMRTNITVEQRKEYLSIIKEEASHVAALIKDLFELAKMDENSFVIKKEKVNLNKFLQHTLSTFQPAYQSKNVKLHLDCKSTIYACIDHNRFKQVIHNLLDNALKHSEPQTNVRVEAKQLKKGIEMTISDEGEGIPESELPYIWERLYRVEKSRSRLTGGTGLGLAIVKKIIESHGAEIRVNSEIGRGTTFTISLLEGE